MKNHGEASPYYPVLLNVRGRKCLVVGGGNVALRKVQALLEHGARMEVVSPVVCQELSQLAEDGAILAHQRDYQPQDLRSVSIVVAATDQAKTNQTVAAEARQLGILVNVVDDAQHSDFIVPSYFERGDITIAVSTSGRSPALARKIRTELEKGFTTEYAQLALLASEVRSELKRQGVTVGSDDWQQALELDLLVNLLRNNRTQEAKDTMLNNLKALGQSKPE